MGIGPFTSFSFPNVYTKTLNEAPRVSAAGALRYPAFIGVGDELRVISNWEMIRGSSSIADNMIVKEDVSSQLNGTNRNFTVSYYPIVSGDGSGKTTDDPNGVEVYVEGEQVPVASVNGATGEIYLVSIPESSDTILISYYYKRTDTLITDDDLSNQADGSNVIFRTNNKPIVQGDNGGITTTNPNHVTVTVDAVAATVSEVDGDTGTITLASAPGAGTTVLATYYTNTHQDTADILPSPSVDSITKVGLAPGTSDFISGTDYVLDTTGAFNTINWGHSYNIASGQHTIATEYFDDSQISLTLFDNRTFRRETTGTTDGTNKTFTLEATPMTGQGLGRSTDDPSKITAYYGTSPTDATVANVAYMRESSKEVVLTSSPPADSTIFVTQYTNLLADDVFTLEVTTAGVGGVGEYIMSGANTGEAFQVLWSSADTTVAGFSKASIEYPAGTGDGNRDTQVRPGILTSDETVSLTFVDANTYVVTSNNASGTGSVGDNTGYLNQTYIDAKTAFRVTLVEASAGDYTNGDIITYKVNSTFVTGTDPTRATPGARMTVTDTEDVGVGDTAIVTTYNKSGAEPSIGDFYYVTFNEEKTDVFGEPYYFTLERNALNFTGSLTATNKLALAAHLCFLNGAPAVSLLQIQKTTGEEDAPDSAYIAGIDVYDEPLENGSRPSLLEPVTASSAVLAYLKTSNTKQSGIRYANERMSYFGFPLNTSPETAQVFARSMSNERMTGIYPDGGITTITDELGQDVEFLVDGAFLAAAVSGRDTSPAFDVAEPLTKKPIVGFTRLFRRMDSVTKAQTANAGLTIFEEQAAGINVKMALTTDLTSILTRTPSVIRIKDFVQKGARAVLEPYIGTKFLNQRTQEVETTLGSYLNALRTAQIIVDYTGIKAEPDPNEASTLNVEAYYSPVLPLLWILITFNLRSRL